MPDSEHSLSVLVRDSLLPSALCLGYRLESCIAPGTVDKPRILIVEDDSDVRRLYALGLNQRGYEVKLAANGAEAVERVATERPDVILLDWLMPLMDGGQVIDSLSRGSGRKDISIIVISGQPAPEGGMLDPRIRCWLTKPVSIDELVTTIQAPSVAQASAGH